MSGRAGVGCVPRVMEMSDIEAYGALRKEMLVEVPWMFAADHEDEIDSHPSVVPLWIHEREHDVVVVDHPDEAGRIAVMIGVRRERPKSFAHRALLWGVYTTPSARGRGLASAAMGLAIEIARGWDGVERLGLCYSGDARGAAELCAAHGFVRFGCEPDFIRIGGRSYDENRLTLKL